MTGVIYARYSSDNQREESIEGQLRECQAFAKKNDITLLEPYIDRALSAKTDHRPNFLKMIKDSAAKKFDVVIVWKLDRFSRNRVDSAHYKYVLRKNGVKVISATESISEGSEGILLESVLEGILFRQTHEGLDQVQEPKGCGLRRLRLSSEGKRQNQPRPRTVCRRNADIQRACDTRRLRRELPQDTGAAEA